MRGGAPRRGLLLDVPSDSISWASRIWSRNALWNMVDLLGSSPEPTSHHHHHEKQQEEKTTGGEKMSRRGLPGFYGSERPASADIHILCHVFQHIPWSPSVELHLRRRNFGLTTHQVILILHKLKDNLTHILNFFIWADQQRGHCHTAECFEILKDTMRVHKDELHPVLESLEASGRFVPLHVLILVMEVFVEKNMIQPALEVFKSISKFRSRPDEYAYNLILQVLLDADRIEDCIEVYDQMKRDKWCRPSKNIVSLILWGLGRAGKVAEARKLLDEAKSSFEVSFNEAHSQLVSGLCEGCWMDYAEEAVIEMYELGLEPNQHVHTSLVSGNTKAGRLTEACRYYVDAVKDKLITPSIELSKMLISGLCDQKDAKTAQKLLDELVNAGFSPDASLYAAIIQCTSKQDQSQVDPWLLDLLKKQKASLDAMFYESIIISCAEAGHMESALSFLCHMVGEEHIQPNEATFWSLLLRLVELNQLDYWKKFFSAMDRLEKDYPTIFSKVLADILNSGDKEVAENVRKMMAERGLHESEPGP